jgi:hypothetical protein
MGTLRNYLNYLDWKMISPPTDQIQLDGFYRGLLILLLRDLEVRVDGKE